MKSTNKIEKRQRFTEVGDLAEALSGSSDFRKKVETEIKQRPLIDFLMAQRKRAGLSQKMIAENMGCDQSKISRIESGDDGQISIIEAAQYLKALGLKMNIGISPIDESAIPSADRIKTHVFAIKEQLEALSDLAKQLGHEDDITQKIAEFRSEVLLNFLYCFEKSRKDITSFESLSVVEIPISETTSCTSVPAQQTTPAESL